MAAIIQYPSVQRIVTARALALAVAMAAPGSASFPRAVLAQQASAAVRGVLLNKESRAPVDGARLSVLGTALVTESDSAGRFVLTGIDPGVRVIQARAIGYAAASWLVQLDEGQIARHEFELEPRIYALAALTADVPGANDWRSEAAFEVRRLRSSGYFFSRTEIAGRRPNTLGDLLTGVPGLLTSCRARSCQVTMLRSSRPCTPEYFLDGHPATNSTGPSFPVHQIRGIEVYGQFEVPIEFQRTGLRCGVIALWTISAGESLDRPGRMIGLPDDSTRPGMRRPRSDPALPPRPPEP